MSEAGAEVPEARVAQRRRVSGVWIIPLVAMLVGAWLTWKSISDKGPTITITFRTAEGLEAGKTMIKYRELEMGVVETIQLADDLSHVNVTARLQKGAERYLTDQTRFWVVRARVTLGGVSGIGTLLSGAYIGMDPVAQGAARTAFTGLESPPLVTSRAEGKLFVLKAPQGSLDVGVPISYRQVQVGEVVRTELDPSGEHVNIDIFVRSPYDERVRQDTRFWNASGFQAKIDENGVQVETASFLTMLIGGVAFDTADGDFSPPAEAGQAFHLYPSKSATVEEVYVLKKRYLLHFDGNVRGLAAGAAVEFRGIQIGHVADVRLEYDVAAETLRIPVIIEIEPERIGIAGEEAVDVGDRLIRLVDRGLRAQLKTGNLLTGQLVVDLDFHRGAPPARVRSDGRYPELPTVPTPLEALATNVNQVLNRLDDLLARVPVEQVGAEATASLRALRKTMDEAQTLTRSVNGTLVPALTNTVAETQKTLTAARQTLEGANRMLGPDSAVNVELQRLFAEMADAARSMRLLADHLERHPEDLIMGRRSE